MVSGSHLHRCTATVITHPCSENRVGNAPWHARNIPQKVVMVMTVHYRKLITILVVPMLTVLRVLLKFLRPQLYVRRRGTRPTRRLTIADVSVRTLMSLKDGSYARIPNYFLT